jgi:membrane glycosyltransferase
VLLLPKFFGLGLALLDGKTRRGCGGGLRLITSALLEIVFSALLAPIMMVIQTGAVLQIAMKLDSGWRPQRRDDGSISFKFIARHHFFHMLLGLVTLIAGLLISPSLVAWMSPTIAGLLLAAVLTWGSGQLSIGVALRRAGFLLTPEEQTTLPIVDGAARWRNVLESAATPGSDGLIILYNDRALRALHKRFLPPPVGRMRGDFDETRVTAKAKLDEAVSIEEAVSWLKPAERTAILFDRELIDRLPRLSSQTPEHKSYPYAP